MSGPRKPGELREVKHLSHSSRETMERCAKSWMLKYKAGAPQRPAVWSAGGSAVHEATEFYDLHAKRGRDMNAEQVQLIWNTALEKQLAEIRAKEPNENLWRRTQAEGLEEWRAMGPSLVQSYIDWRQRSPWELWTTPDGEPAIELDISGRLPGCEPEIKAYLDRVFWDPVFKKLWILDLKSGKRAPTTPDQFGVYAALLRVKYDVQVDWGVAFLNRKSELGKPFDLSGHTPEFVGAVFSETWDEIKRGSFPANGFPNACFICDVQSACAKQNGPLAHIYDPASPGHPSNDPPY
ncbi:RecB family exonuclease [Streptomyces sp. NPDC087420]|uniref:RecB family exonuclease n=1 Tax=Streptomyces sp. NPDC087420 TaxID=3365785 RepID=UPI003837C67E